MRHIVTIIIVFSYVILYKQYIACQLFMTSCHISCTHRQNLKLPKDGQDMTETCVSSVYQT